MPKRKFYCNSTVEMLEEFSHLQRIHEDNVALPCQEKLLRPIGANCCGNLFRFVVTIGFPIHCLDLNMENISRTHLQELFDSFPSTEAGDNNINDANSSDEEYQIYEPDSDGNYSDDDDC